MRFPGSTSIGMSLLGLPMLVFSSTSVPGQGSVTLANAIDDIDAPIYDVDGITPLAGTAFLAQLYAAAPGSSLAPIGSPTTFLTGANAGYVQAIDEQVPGVPAFSIALIQVVAWRASDGATFAAANHLGGQVGESAILNIRLGCSGTPACLPADLVGLQSFSLHVVVPEPSPAALAVLGLALLGPRARRRFAESSRQPRPAGHHGPVQPPRARLPG